MLLRVQGECVIHFRNRNSAEIGARVWYLTYCSHRMLKIMIGDEQGRRSINVRPHEVNIYIDASAIYLKVVRCRRIQREGLVATAEIKAVEM